MSRCSSAMSLAAHHQADRRNQGQNQHFDDVSEATRKELVAFRGGANVHRAR
jgi:hypothetical protein